MEQKKFMDIARIREGDELTEPNTYGFHKGDIIQISEKIDGSNAAIRYDEETGELVAFSRKRRLDFQNTLNGFWNYVQRLDVKSFEDTPNLVVFGEWLEKHTVLYFQSFYHRWYVYDIYDVEREAYMPQDFVKDFCNQHDLEYVSVFYEGEFISWEHCKSFVGKSRYTETGRDGEGIVVKNQTELNNPNSRQPFVLKIINDKFSEIQLSNHIRKVEDPQRVQERNHAQEIVNKIVTQNRVEKEIHKMVDEGILPEKIAPQDMKIVAQNLPKRIYDDCMKEEKEYVMEAGEFFGKLCNAQTMKFARTIILG